MKKLLALALTFSPALVSAQQLNDINTVAQKATNIGNLVVQLAISLAVIWIIISVIRYLIISSDEGARKEGGMRILYGVVALFVILSIWGLVYLLTNSFQFGNNRAPSLNNIKISPPPTVQ